MNDVLGPDGKPLTSADRGSDGNIINPTTNLRAGIMGTILLLEQIARRDQDADFRREARIQADSLRGMIRRRAGKWDASIDAAIMEDVGRYLSQRPALGAPTKRLPAPDVIDMGDA